MHKMMRTENQSGSDSWYINSSVDSHVFLSGSVYYILTWMHKMTRMEYQHGSDSSYINSSVDSQYQHGYNSSYINSSVDSHLFLNRSV
jgi:hypothetical protein